MPVPLPAERAAETKDAAPLFDSEKIDKNEFIVAKNEDVIGQLVKMKLANGDTLPDIGRHFSLGINAVNAANPAVDTWVPSPEKSLVLPLSFILPSAPKKGIVINLAAMRLFFFRRNSNSTVVSTYPVGIGTEERPSPVGQMYIERKMALPTWHVPASIAEDHRKKGDPLPPKVPPGPLNPLGEYALYLNKGSYLIHGTNKPASIGLRATNGCIRLYPEDIKKLYEIVPVNTPVSLVNQPYLIGRRNGVVYLEVHEPMDDLSAVSFDGTYAQLRNIERQSKRNVDWSKVKQVLAEARGYPVPVLDLSENGEKKDMEIVEIKRPNIFYGRPEVPEWKIESWYVLAANTSDSTEAERLAAIINHQGPPIPARVLSAKGSHRVIAGPFDTVADAKEAARRLRIDLEIEGILMEPLTKK